MNEVERNCRADGMMNSISSLHTAFDCDETAMYSQRPSVRCAKGLYLWLEGEIEPYLDLIQGYSVTIFGHCDEELIEAAIGSLRTVDHVSGMTSPPREELANLLSELSPVDSPRVYFDVGGAHIVSMAIRLARRVTRKKPLLALRNAFHGYSTEGEKLSETFIGGPAEGTDSTDIELVEIGSPDLFPRLMTRRYAALLIEPLQGANGLVPLPEEWIKESRRACSESGTLLISDEVQVGLGRTGTFAAIERYGISPDIVTYGKALCAGVFPLSALVVNEEVYKLIPDYPASALGSTFSTSPFACAVGAHVVRRVKGLLDNGTIHKLGQDFCQSLNSLAGRFGITSIKCYGLGLAIVYRDAEDARRFVKTALRHKIIVYACGREKNVIKLYPPYTVTENEARHIGELLIAVAIEADQNKLEGQE